MSEADDTKRLIQGALKQLREMDSALLKYDAALQTLTGLVMELHIDVPDLTPQFTAIMRAKLEIINAQLPIQQQLKRWEGLV